MSAGPDGLVELEVGPPAHGGHCVARLPDGDGPGRVVFVRHALPGERVVARLTAAEPGASYWRADAVEVRTASPDRVGHPWPAAGPGGVGGAELGHVALPAQRRWKAEVLAEQLRRLGRLAAEDPLLAGLTVEAAPGDDVRGGLGWRTRVDLVTDGAGRAGMRVHRSHRVVPLDAMPLATEEVAALGLFDRRWRGERVSVAAPVGGRPVVTVDGVPFDLRRGRPDPGGAASVHETVLAGGREHRYRVAATGFWQVHREAPGLLAGAVLDAVAAVAGEGARVADLYAGAGLFTQPLADLVGERGRVVAVEGDARAVRDARRGVHDRPQVTLQHGDVVGVLGEDAVGPADAVVLDPPRVGAGRAVVDGVAATGARRVVYVACDPAALGRDVAYLAGHGYRLTGLRALDLFPMTHHLEAVAVLDRDRP